MNFLSAEGQENSGTSSDGNLVLADGHSLMAAPLYTILKSVIVIDTVSETDVERNSTSYQSHHSYEPIGHNLRWSATSNHMVPRKDRGVETLL